MDRVTVLLGWRDGRKPHVCGDGPPSERWGMKHTAKTPRMWGWTGIYQQAPDWNFENPTYVGMDRATKTRLPTCWPKTPRMWGWTVTLPDFEAMADENPTYVGMDR